DAAIGRFIEQDDLQFMSGDFNFYRYVDNSPTNALDPSGNEIISIGILIIIGVVLVGVSGCGSENNPAQNAPVVPAAPQVTTLTQQQIDYANQQRLYLVLAMKEAIAKEQAGSKNAAKLAKLNTAAENLALARISPSVTQFGNYAHTDESPDRYNMISLQYAYWTLTKNQQAFILLHEASHMATPGRDDPASDPQHGGNPNNP